MTITLNNRFHGYYDFEVQNHIIHRACVPFNIKKGDLFNVYFGEHSKAGLIWEGTLEQSIKVHGSTLQDLAKTNSNFIAEQLTDISTVIASASEVISDITDALL